MSFNNIELFHGYNPVNPKIVQAGKELLEKLPSVQPGDITRGYFHWSVAGTCSTFSDYHVMVNYSRDDFKLNITHDVRDNAVSTFSDNYATHTFHRNEGAVAICLAGMDGASPNNFGPDPVTVMGLTYMCAGMAALAIKYNLDCIGTATNSFNHAYNNEPVLATHALAAILTGNPPQYDNYGVTGSQERWDLATFSPVPEGYQLTAHDCVVAGNALRQQTHAYKISMLK